MRLPVCLSVLTMSVLAGGCGPTVGDACTTTQECGGATCINRDFAPGGYCSKTCATSDATSCPHGTTCIVDAIARDIHGCMRTCSTERDCRPGYLCKPQRNYAQGVCVGPAGL